MRFLKDKLQVLVGRAHYPKPVGIKPHAITGTFENQPADFGTDRILKAYINIGFERVVPDVPEAIDMVKETMVKEVQELLYGDIKRTLHELRAQLLKEGVRGRPEDIVESLLGELE